MHWCAGVLAADIRRRRGWEIAAIAHVITDSLPKITRVESQTARREIAEIRHSSLYAPRDFDISPYFMVVKPTLARGFNYKDMLWADLPQVHTAKVTLAPEVEGAFAEVASAGISRMRH